MSTEKVTETIPKGISNEIWLVYDGECPICNYTARRVKVRQSVGDFHIINAREAHPIIDEINSAGLDLDEGMILKFENTLYHGAEAMHVLAMIGSSSDWFNYLNVFLFRRSKVYAKLSYPIFRAIRNMALRLKGVSKINKKGHPNA